MKTLNFAKQVILGLIMAAITLQPALLPPMGHPVLFAQELTAEQQANAQAAPQRWDAYLALGLKLELRFRKDGAPNYSYKEIRRAYRRKMAELTAYQNTNTYTPEQMAEIIKVRTAWKVLSDPKSRQAYNMSQNTEAWRNTEMSRYMPPRPPSAWEQAKFQFGYQTMHMPLEMVVFMLTSTFVGASFAAARGDWDAAEMMFDQLGDIGGWLGFGTFTVGQAGAHVALSVVIGRLIGEAMVGQISTILGMQMDHLFRNVWMSEEFAKTGLNWSEWSYAKKRESELKTRLFNLQFHCNMPQLRTANECNNILPEVKKQYEDAQKSLEKYKNLYWDYLKLTMGKVFKMTPKEHEQFAQDAAHLVMSGIFTSYIMSAGHKITESNIKPFFKLMYKGAKEVPKSALPTTLTVGGAAGAGRIAQGMHSLRQLGSAVGSWVVKDAAGKILWTSSAVASSKGVFGFFKYTLSFAVRRFPHLTVFLSVMDVTGAGWGDIAKSLQLRGWDLWIGNLSFSNNTDKVTKAGQDFLAKGHFSTYMVFDRATQDFFDDFGVWNDSIVFKHVNELYLRFNSRADEARSAKMIQEAHMNWFLESLVKFEKAETLDTNHPFFKENDLGGGFKWHADIDSKEYRDKMYHPEWGYYTQFRKHYLPRFLDSRKNLIKGEALKAKAKEVLENYQKTSIEELEKKISELQTTFETYEIPKALSEALYGKNSVVRTAAWTEYDKLRSEARATRQTLITYTNMCNNTILSASQPDICQKRMPELAKKLSELNTKIATMKKDYDLTLWSRIRSLITSKNEIPLYKVPNASRGQLIGQYNYTDSLNVQFKMFRSLLLGLNPSPNDFSAILVNALQRCEDLSGYCLYEMIDVSQRIAAMNLQLIFSADDPTLPSGWKQTGKSLEVFKTADDAEVKVGNSVGFFSTENRSDAVVLRFARVFSYIASEMLLLPVREKRMSRIDLNPISTEEFYKEPFALISNNSLNEKDPYYNLNRDIRYASLIAKNESTKQEFQIQVPGQDGQPQVIEMIPWTEARQEISLADLDGLMDVEFAQSLEWRTLRDVNPYLNELLRKSVPGSNAGNNQDERLESLKQFLNSRFRPDRSIRMMVKRVQDPRIGRLGIRAGDILLIADTIQKDGRPEGRKANDKEVDALLIGRQLFRDWIENIKKNKHPSANLMLLRSKDGTDLRRTNKYESNDGRDGILQAVELELVIKEHPQPTPRPQSNLIAPEDRM